MSAIAAPILAIIAVVATAVAGSVLVLVIFMLWKSGTLVNAWDVITTFVSGGWGALGRFWGFLTELVKAM